MSIVLFHHPFTRASNVVWMLEEVGTPYELRWVDIMKGAHKDDAVTKLNPMGKLPLLTDGDATVTEAAAIGLYLADKYAYGTLSPTLDDPARGTYFRWSLYAPSVIEPGSLAKERGWDFKPSQAGWGDHASMVATMKTAIEGRQFILGDTFSMADVIFGGTLRFMLRFEMLEPHATFSEYVERLGLAVDFDGYDLAPERDDER